MTELTPSVHIAFTPSGRRGEVPVGITVLDAARSLGVDLDSVCGGRGLCGRCQVEPSFGEFAKHGIDSRQESLSPSGAMEAEYRGRRPIEPDGRLGCAVRVLNDVVIDVPEASQVHQQVVRKRLEVADMAVDPVIRLYMVEVPVPELDRPEGELRRLTEALRDQWGLDGLGAGLRTIVEMQAALDKDRIVTVAIRDGTKIVAVWPGFRDGVFGIAIDVGSTTIAGHLLDLSSGDALASAGLMNPQIRFGDDLMSRVSYVMMNRGGEVELTRAVRQSLNDLVGELCAEADVARDDIFELVMVGNPIMHHLLLGLDAVPLGGAPFVLATDQAIEVTASDLDLEAHPEARVYVLPCIAGHVGADTAGAILSERPHAQPGVQLLVDVGTNAEIVLGSADRLLAASSPTGPAFEGAQISAGQRATVGAIERVRIDKETLEPRIKVIGSDLWSDEAGFAEAVADTGVTGICGSGIIEAVAEMFLAGIISMDGVVNGSMMARSSRITDFQRTFSYDLYEGRVGVTQNDIRAIQLAKGALYAGIRLLMDHLGVDNIDSIRLAGAFGSHIDTTYAMVLGLYPDCALDQVSSAGNAAGTGAVMALLSQKARTEIEMVVRTVEKIETATEPKFQDHFIDAMAFPHRTAQYPNLSVDVALPGRTENEQAAAGGHRRRRPRPIPSGQSEGTIV